MSDEQKAYAVPLWELLRKIPKDYRVSIPFQWAENGAETGHHMIPVGHLMHRAADELAAHALPSAKLPTAEEMTPNWMATKGLELLKQAGYDTHNAHPACYSNFSAYKLFHLLAAPVTPRPEARREFKPTHRHADGGLYRLVARSKYKPDYVLSGAAEWTDAIIYEGEDGKLWVTTPARWGDRFSEYMNKDRQDG